MMYRLFVLLISLCTLFNIAQASKPADLPNDAEIQIITDDGEQLCYAPVFTQGEGYVYLDYCNSGSVKPARYDLFGRISFDINSNAICITAPANVTGIDGKSTDSWDYLRLRPCAINDENQKWLIEDRFVYTKDKRFRVKGYKYYAYISKNDTDPTNHRLKDSMKRWIKTVASPASLSIRTPVFWILSNPYGFHPYFLMNNQSTGEGIVYLYYNPLNGHIAQYDAGSGTYQCLTSHTNKSDAWNWASWESCYDKIALEADKSHAWNLDIGVENDYLIRDYWNSVLRVTRYGSNWGVPYTAKASFIPQDTSNAPTSTFVMAKEVAQFNQLNNASTLDILDFCPGGNSLPSADNGLPHDFRLTDAWRGRLWQIALSTNPQIESSAGICGVCMLQGMQMIAELLYYNQPQSGGGYYFNTAPETDPFISFTERYPDAVTALDNIFNYLTGVAFSESDEFVHRIVPAIISTVELLLPNHQLVPTEMARGDRIRPVVDDLFHAPSGSVWMAFMFRTTPEGTLHGHAEALIRTEEGIILLPANNAYLSLAEFHDATQPRLNADQILHHYSEAGQYQINMIMFVRVNDLPQNSLSTVVVPANCSDKDHPERGHGSEIKVNALNQCESGRCM